MIKLYGFGTKFGVVEPSPFVLKVDTFMRIAQIPFEVDNDSKNLSRAPKGKLPFIEDNGKIVADSFFILDYLKHKFQPNIDDHLSVEQHAITHLISKSLDENLIYCLLYSRWVQDDTWPIIKQAFFGQMPPVIKTLVPKIFRKKVIKGLNEQGFGRHSHEEITQLTQTSLQSLSDLLGDQLYYFNSKPSTLDACCYAFLAQFILVDIKNPFNHIARNIPNLVAYCDRIYEQYYRT